MLPIEHMPPARTSKLATGVKKVSGMQNRMPLTDTHPKSRGQFSDEPQGSEQNCWGIMLRVSARQRPLLHCASRLQAWPRATPPGRHLPSAGLQNSLGGQLPPGASQRGVHMPLTQI
jgi:hypothetical protein